MQCQKLKTYMETGRVVFLPVKVIRANPDQPRQVFRPEALAELADSIREHGILQPLSVRRVGTGYELIAGERRLRAAAMAGLTEVPCILMQMDDRESGLAAMVENLQRQDLDFIEEAMGIARLVKDWGMSQEQAARLLGKSQSAIANKLRLLKHSEPVLAALREAGLTERHARALLRLSDGEERLRAAEHIGKQELNVAQAEAYIDRLVAAKQAQPPRRRPTYIIKDVRLFLNSVERGIRLMRGAGVGAQVARQDTDSEICLTVRIPKKAGQGAAGR